MVAFSTSQHLPCCPLIHEWISSPLATPLLSQLLPTRVHMAQSDCCMPNPILALASRVKPLMLPAVHGRPPQPDHSPHPTHPTHTHTNPLWTMEWQEGRAVGMGGGGVASPGGMCDCGALLCQVSSCHKGQQLQNITWNNNQTKRSKFPTNIWLAIIAEANRFQRATISYQANHISGKT